MGKEANDKVHRYRFARIQIKKYTTRQMYACYKLWLEKGKAPDGFARIIIINNGAYNTIASEDPDEEEYDLPMVSSDGTTSKPKNRKRIELFINRRKGNPIETWQWYQLIGLSPSERNVSIEPTSKKEYDACMSKFKDEIIIQDKQLGEEVYTGPNRELQMLKMKALKMGADKDVLSKGERFIRDYIKEKTYTLKMVTLRQENILNRYISSLSEQGNGNRNSIVQTMESTNPTHGGGIEYVEDSDDSSESSD